MARIHEVKERQEVVKTVAGFTNSLQQIAAIRMMKLRNLVLSSKRFVEEATIILRELYLEKEKLLEKEKIIQQVETSPRSKSKQNVIKPTRTAIIVVSSDLGLCGSYNTEINNKLKQVIPEYPNADYYVIGKKGQTFMQRRSPQININYYPYNIPEEVTIKDLEPLIGMFFYYDQIFLLYSKYINTTTRSVDFIELSVPNIEELEVQKEKAEGKFIFEPSVDELIASISGRVRYALFRQQILDSKLSLYTAQMIAMKTASDNADDLLDELQHEHNKLRRKEVDKKIQEVQAGRILWEDQ